MTTMSFLPQGQFCWTLLAQLLNWYAGDLVPFLCFIVCFISATESLINTYVEKRFLHLCMSYFSCRCKYVTSPTFDFSCQRLPVSPPGAHAGWVGDARWRGRGDLCLGTHVAPLPRRQGGKLYCPCHGVSPVLTPRPSSFTPPLSPFPSP